MPPHRWPSRGAEIGAGVPAAAGQPDIDPRIERSRRLILSAAIELLGELGYGGLTIEGVAARAGVGKSTIYRHWTGRLDLIEEAIGTLKAAIVVPTGGSVRQRVTGLLRQVATNLADSSWSACLPAIIDAAQRDPEVLAVHRRLSVERRQMLVDLLAEGVATGEVPAGADLNLIAECLVGPIVIRRLLLHETFDPADVPALVRQVLPPRLPPRAARRGARPR